MDTYIFGAEKRPIKLVVWDLDQTLWSGTLAEGDNLVLRPAAHAAVVALDRIGVLQSIASRNDQGDALRALEQVKLAEHFLEPRIGWGAKSGAIQDIADALNLGISNTAFVDDDEFERSEVAAIHPSIRCYDAHSLTRLVSDCRGATGTVTDEGASRRTLYIAERDRLASEAECGDVEAFSRTLALEIEIQAARPGDLTRIEELIRRSSQLNATGYVYAPEELAEFVRSPHYHLFCVAARDRFGDYGKIGAILIDQREGSWVIKLLIVSCRVMSRGIGTIVLAAICHRAHELALPLLAHYRRTDRNRAMLIALRFAGFAKVADLAEGGMLLERTAALLPNVPDHVRLQTPW